MTLVFAGLVFVSNSTQAADEPGSKSILATKRESWKYVGDPAEGPTMRPLFHVVRLSSVPPPGVRETAAYRGRSRLYGEIRFGSENSEPVLLVIDRIDESASDLFVDGNRNRVIENKDKASPAAARHSAAKTPAAQHPVYEWVVPLAAQIVQRNTARLFPRKILVRWRGSPEAVSIATVGYCAGTVELGGRHVQARRSRRRRQRSVCRSCRPAVDRRERRRHVGRICRAVPDDSLDPDRRKAVRRAGRSTGGAIATRSRCGGRPCPLATGGPGPGHEGPAAHVHACRRRRNRVYACRLGADGRAERPLLNRHAVIDRRRRERPELELPVLARSWRAAPRTIVVEQDRDVNVDPLGRMSLSFQNEYQVTQAKAGQTLCYRPLLHTSQGLNTKFCRIVDDTSDRANDPTAAHFRLQSLAGQVLDRAESHYECGTALCDFAVTVPIGIRARELKLDGDVDLGPVAGKVTAARLIPIAANRP